MLKKLQICFLGLLCLPKSKFKSNWLVDILCSIKTLFPRHWRDIFIPKFRDYLSAKGGISPLIGGLFHRRSRSISRHSKNYLCDKGAVFRQPQADISQKRSDFISQAEGLCISNFLNQKWFVKTFLILSILLSSINEVSSQVADSPGADFLHRSRPIVPHELRDTHRSGETRSDTLAIGDQIPEGIEFSNVLQYDSDKLKLEDFEGKYLVFQFWATWCTASSGFLPELDKLQQQFGDDLQILPITYQSREEVMESIALRPVLQNLDFPLIVGDNRLRKIFPHVTFPHLVIIDPQGEVVAITGSQDFNATHISELLSNGTSDFRTKVDEQVSVDMDERLISGNTHIPNKNIRYQSALTAYIPGVPGSAMDSRKDGAHILMVNSPLIKLYRQAYTGRDLANFFSSNRIITEGFDEEELDSRKSGLDYIAWMEEGDKVFGYELIAPPGVDQYALMRQDLKRYFPHIKAEVQLRKRTVLALVQPEGFRYPASEADEKHYRVRPYEADLQKSLLTGLIYQMNLYFLQRSPYPLIDKTGIDYPIDIRLEGNFSKVEELTAAFRKVGLDLVQQEEEIPVLILTKINPEY